MKTCPETKKWTDLSATEGKKKKKKSTGFGQLKILTLQPCSQPQPPNPTLLNETNTNIFKRRTHLIHELLEHSHIQTHAYVSTYFLYIFGSILFLYMICDFALSHLTLILSKHLPYRYCSAILPESSYLPQVQHD